MKVSNINWEDFFQAINHPALILDSSHFILAANKASQDYMGLSEDKILGKKCFELIHSPNSKESPFCCPLEKLKEKGINEPIEMEMEAFGGYALVSCTPIFDENGALDKIIHIATDITYQKKSEIEYRTLFESSGALLLTFDNNGNIIKFNSEWEKLTGYSREEVEGKMKWMEFVHPDYLGKMIEYHQRRVKDPDSVPNKYDTVIVRKDGDLRKTYITVTGLPETDKWLVSASDITDLKNTQKKLEKNVLFSRALTEYALDGIITTDAHGKILYFNNSLLEMFGYSRDELKKSPLTILMPERYRENFMDNLSKFRLTGEHRLAGRTIETIGLNKEGNEFPFEMSLTKWEIGEKIYFTSIIRDITERKKNEKAILESEQKYSHLFESVPVGISITNIATAHAMDANKAMLEINGYTLEEYKSITLKDTFVHPEDRELLLKELKEKGKVRDYEVKLKRKDGNIYYALINSELIEMGGQKVAINTLRDISERKKGEKARRKGEMALKESEEKYKAIMDYSSDAVFLADFEGNFVECNKKAETFLGYSQDEILQLNFKEIHPPEELEKVLKEFKKAITEDMGVVETLVLTKDNKKVPVAITSSMVKYGDKKILQGIFRDITDRKKAEKSLKESEEKYKTLFESDPDYTILIGSDGVILDVNLAAVKIVGISKDELIGKRFSELGIFPEEELNLHNEKFSHTLKHGRIDPYRARVFDKNGRIRWVQNQSTAIMKDNKLNYVLVIGRDITDQKQAEDDLKESKQRLSEIIGFLPDATFAIDMEGKVIAWNQAIEEMTEVKSESIMGKANHEYSIPFYGVRRPILIDLVLEYDKEVENSYSFIQRDGRALLAETDVKLNDENRVLWVKAVPLYDSENNINGAVESIRDITQSKIYESALKKSEGRFRAVAESAVDAIVTTDSNGDIIFFNNSLTKIFGYKKDEIKGKPLTLLMPERFKKDYLDELKKFEKSGKHRLIGKTVTTTGLRKDKKEFPFEMSLSAWKSGGKTYFTSIIRDLTERKKADEQIKKSLQEKEVLLREIHHRVKNNMQIISSLLNLQIQFEGLDETVDVLKDSQGRVRSMALVHEKLYQSDNFSEINFKDYTEKLIFDIFSSYGIKGRIKWELDIKDVNVGIDTAVPLGLIINELVTNSVKYAFPDGREGIIKIVFKLEGNNYVLSISDDGVGIPADFDPEKTETLGLQLIKSLVDQLDGSLELDRSLGTKYTIIFQELKYRERI